MLDEVKVCVDAKVNFINEYFTVPNDLQSTIDEFIKDVNSLGETGQDANDFEAQFISSGLSEKFQTIIQQCTPKTHKMTKEEKQKSAEITKSILKENKKEIVGDMASRSASKVLSDIRGEMATRSREQMIEDGTFAEHTIITNNINSIGRLARFFGKKSKQNKNEE